jgi:hypothetical protein
LAVLWLTLAGPESAPAAGPTPAPKADKPGNAALQYWQAFALLPPLTKERNQILDDLETVELKGPVLPLIEEAKNALTFLHRGARLADCDWGLNKEDGVGIFLPHLAKARELSKYALLHARYQFAKGQVQAGIDDVTDTIALARHIGAHSVFLGLLVQYAIENRAIDTLAKYLPDLNDAAQRHLAARLNALPRGGSFKAGMRAEKEIFIGGSIRQFKEGRHFSEPVVGALLRAAGGLKDPVTWIEEVGKFYEDVIQLPPLPRDQFLKRVNDLSSKLADNPFGKLLLPACDKVYEAGERNQAKRAMLQAALAVVKNGPEALKTIRDPFGEGPFEYRALKHGFELKSQLKGPPMTLVVGRDPK